MRAKPHPSPDSWIGSHTSPSYMHRANFLYYRKLRGIDLAVLHCLNTRKTAIGEQPPAGAQIAKQSSRFLSSSGEGLAARHLQIFDYQSLQPLPLLYMKNLIKTQAMGRVSTDSRIGWRVRCCKQSFFFPSGQRPPEAACFAQLHRYLYRFV